MTALRERARAAVFAAGGRGFVRFLPAGETALLVSDAPRRCGDVPALLDGCRAAGFDARERNGLLLLTPTEAALRALDILGAQGVPARVIDYPGGMDPDEFVRANGAEAWNGKVRRK